MLERLTRKTTQGFPGQRLELRNADGINRPRLRRDFVRRQGRKTELSELSEGFLTRDSRIRSSKVD